MRMLFYLIMTAFILSGCGSSGDSGKDQKQSEQIARFQGKELLRKNDCLTCHTEDQKMVGPAYKEVAAKYAGQEGAVELLANKVIHGGSGVWGDTAMVAHPNLSKEDARKMVTYILSVH